LKELKDVGNQENAGALCNLEFMYALGKGVARSDKNTVQWWQKAADNEHALALLILGVLFAANQGIETAKQASTNFYQEQGIFSMESSAQDPIPMAWW
jgi:hypothetical protein